MDIITKKRCAKCKKWKAPEEFHKNKSKKDGLHDWCKTCRASDPNKSNPSRGIWKHRLSEKDFENGKAVCSSCGPTKITKRGLFWRCVNALKGSNRKDGRPGMGYRSGICPICKNYSDKLVYDHDHKTGEFRGWICDRCNAGLGHFKDNTRSLINAVKYLKNLTRV